jgi:flavin-binding protein dodecin
MQDHIEQGAVKIIELLGVSPNSFDDAVQVALQKASRTLEGINGIEVLKLSAKVRNGTISEYHANVKLAFAVK